MKQIIILLVSTFMVSFSMSQNNVVDVLYEIEKNNTGLSAIRKSIDAEMIGNKTGLFLDNPEVGFNYLWGNHNTDGNRIDFSIKQSFDFPTAYGHKNDISDIKNSQLELEYQKQLRSLLYQSRLVCYDLIYLNAKKIELVKRINHAQSIANAYEALFESGDGNILEYNKSQLNLLNITQDIELVEIENKVLMLELERLNGGKPIYFDVSSFPILEISNDFEHWYNLAEQNNPMLNWLKQEITINKQQEKLSKAMSLPKIQAGYMSEEILSAQFRGVTLGLQIPLWQNKNTVKYSHATTLALESLVVDSKLQYYNKLKALYSKASNLQENIINYREKLQRLNNTVLLKKALDLGEISLINYFQELSIYYESVTSLLEMDRALNSTYAELIYLM
ncbi:MAG: TolC family protein [Bacteroidota bacterium]